MNRTKLAATLTGTALALALPMLLPSRAEACGGNFCDSGPQTMPVDQTGENIVFHIGQDTVEAHIQIQIDPDSGAEGFAWVIPVTALPEFEVGSQLFFDAILAGSVPSYGLQQQSDFCGDETGFGGDDEVGTDGWGDEDGGETGDTGEEPGPTVVLETTLGAFDIAVLDGGTVESVMQWLGDNGYQQDPAAEPILAQYLEEEFLFVALKLTADTGVEEIHPIVIRYGGTEPCVPIRLTAIAAAEDMDIRAFFFQDARTVPINYRHVLVNPLKIDWFNNAANYKEVITMAVDADEADGNAFVTEYAGPSSVVNTNTILGSAWSSAPVAALTDSPVGVVDELTSQNLMVCDQEWDETCTYNHPLLEGLLQQFVPVPDGIAAVDFYACLECYTDLLDLEAWDAQAFADLIDERIIDPGIKAVALVENNPYLTRLYTTISPSEMGEDPMFRVNATLPDVPNVRLATQTNHCDGSATVTLPDGREVVFAAQTNLEWPDFDDQMPWEEDVDQENMAENAPLISLVDNTETIDALLNDHNAKERGRIMGFSGGGCTCSVDEGDSPRGLAFGLLALGLCGLVRRRKS